MRAVALVCNDIARKLVTPYRDDPRLIDVEFRKGVTGFSAGRAGIPAFLPGEGVLTDSATLLTTGLKPRSGVARPSFEG
jgi:hypothetical protein